MDIKPASLRPVNNLSDVGDAAASNANLGTHATKAAAVAATIPSTLDTITLLGYWAQNDGGRATWKRAGSEPSHSAKFQSADGAWWEISETRPSSPQFGTKGDGVQDDSVYFQVMADWGDSVGVTEFYVPDPLVQYLCNSSIKYRTRQTFRGAGIGSTKLYFVDCHGFEPHDPASSPDGVSILDLWLVGNAPTSLTATDITDVTNTAVDPTTGEGGSIRAPGHSIARADHAYVTEVTGMTEINYTAVNNLGRKITSITKANPGAATTANDHQYTTGDQVLFYNSDMTEVNGNTYTIIVTGAKTFTIGVDTSGFAVVGTSGTVTNNNVVTTDLDTSAFTPYAANGKLALMTRGLNIYQTTDVMTRCHVDDFCFCVLYDVSDINSPHRDHFDPSSKYTQKNKPNYRNGYPYMGILFSGAGGRGQSQANTGGGIFMQAQTRGNEAKYDGDGVTDTFTLDNSAKAFGLLNESGIQVWVIDATTGVPRGDVNDTTYDLYATDDAMVDHEIALGDTRVSTYSTTGLAGLLTFEAVKFKVVFRAGSIPVAGVDNVIIHWSDPTGVVGYQVSDGTGNYQMFDTIGGYSTGVAFYDGQNYAYVVHMINTTRAGYMSVDADESSIYVKHPQLGTMGDATMVVYESTTRRASLVENMRREPIRGYFLADVTISASTYTTLVWAQPTENLATANDYTSGLPVARACLKFGRYHPVPAYIQVIGGFTIASTTADMRCLFLLEVSRDGQATWNTLRTITVGDSVTATDVEEINGTFTMWARDDTVPKRTANRMPTYYYRLSVKRNSGAGDTSITVRDTLITAEEVGPA